MNDVDERIADYAARWRSGVVLPDVPDLRRAPRRWPVVLAAVTTAAASVALAAVVAGAVLRDEAPPRNTPPPAAAPAPAPAPVVGLDRHHVADAAFFGRFAAAPGASEVERYSSLREAYREAGAVVVARVTDVRVTRTVPAGSPDAVTYVGVVLDPVEVLRGELRDPSVELVVEFSGDPAAVRAALPAGYGVWFLRNKADLAPGLTPKPGAPRVDESAYYRLVSSQGLFVQGPTHVVNPVRERATGEAGGPSADPETTGPRDPVAREAEAFPTLTALLTHLRLLP